MIPKRKDFAVNGMTAPALSEAGPAGNHWRIRRQTSITACQLGNDKKHHPMKTRIQILAVAAALCVSLLAVTAADKDKHLATPKGGRLLEKTEPHAEFVVEKDHSVTINFYNEAMKPVPPTTQNVTVIADAKSGKATLQFEKKGDALVSKTKLPEGDGYNVVVQFKQTAESKQLNLRFKLDLGTCGECKRAEYGCICGH
jgi:hypothetical protein